MRATPTLAEVLRGAIRAQLADVHTGMPARVTAYDRAKQRCSVQPLIQREYRDEAGVRQIETLPVITDVPVVFPGSGGYGITWPVGVGTTGFVKFSECSIDQWLARGGLVDPRDDRRHAMSDAIFEPGLRPFNAAVSDTSPAAMVLFTEGEIHAGGTDKLALRDELNALRAFVMQQFTGAGHGHAVSGAATTSTLPIVAPQTAPATAFAGTQVLKGG